MDHDQHAVVWLDHSEAKIFRFAPDEETEVHIHSHLRTAFAGVQTGHPGFGSMTFLESEPPARTHHTLMLRSHLLSLLHWDPFADVNTLIRFMPSASAAGLPRLAGEGKGARKIEWSPSADISETDKAYVVRVELPAVRKEDVKVTIDQGLLTIFGERKQQTDDKNEKFHRVESYYGSFERSFSLPDNVNAETVRGESKDGILTVTIPKIEAPKHTVKQIVVQ